MTDIAATIRDAAKRNAHYEVLRQNCLAAAAEIERLRLSRDNCREDFAALQHALVGKTGLSAMGEAKRLRAMHPMDRKD